MKKNKVSDVEESKLRKFIEEIYKCFLRDPYEFEYFCKLFFIKEGFDEVEVTKRSKDGGIDLKAIKKGYDENGVDTLSYKIQAKRLKPNTTVPIKQIRELKGVLEGHEKGIFITTGNYTKESFKFVNYHNPQCIILIDGLNLVKRCIELDIGFLYKPVFCKEDLMKSLDKYKYKYKYKQLDLEVAAGNVNHNTISMQNILKIISVNDIKTRILPIPKVIFDKIPKEMKSFRVVFNYDDEFELNINRDRKYFGGITEIYRKYRLIDDDNNSIPKESYWNIDEKSRIINIEFRN